MGVIHVSDGIAQVELDGCVECSNCFRMCPDEGYNPLLVRSARRMLSLFRLRYNQPIAVCPTGALRPPDLEWPRDLRRFFSDPPKVHPTTGYPGRGTEEIKTNDVTGRLGPGDVGFVVEVGRPGIGATFRDVEKITMALAKIGVKFERRNPLAHLMIGASGKLRNDLLDETILSAVVEFRTTLRQVPKVLHVLEDVEKEVDTVFSVGISARCVNGKAPYRDVIEACGWELSRQAKINVGLGRAG